MLLCSCRRLTVFALSLLLVNPIGISAPSQTTGAAASSGRQVDQPHPPDADKLAAEWRDKREKAQAELNAMGRPGAPATGAPPDATQEELQERRSLLERIIRGYDEQLSDLQRLAEARQRHADIARSSGEWKGFPEPTPYSIFLADQLRDAAYSLRLAMEELQSQLELLTLRFERTRDMLTAAEERPRQAAERLEAVKDPAQAARERWPRSAHRRPPSRSQRRNFPRPACKKNWQIF